MAKHSEVRRLPCDELRERAARLGLHGLAGRASELDEKISIEELLGIEEQERARRSLERRVRQARIGAFKPMADFDWSWPKKIDRELVEELFRLDFLAEAANVVLIGPNGVGKTTLAKNLAHQALIQGSTVCFASASAMLSDLSSQDGPSALERRLRRYLRPALLVIDEVGYLSYNAHHADLLFDVVNRRNQDKSTIVTTNKAFTEWNEVFPNSSSVVALIDRLVHRAEIVEIDGASYRLKEATERTQDRRKRRQARGKARHES
jgi:DNA replication protein DnaC